MSNTNQNNQPNGDAQSALLAAANSIGHISFDGEDDAVDLQYAYNTLMRLGSSSESSANYANDLQVAESAGNALRDICHGDASSAGWWRNPKSGQDPRENPMCFSQKLCLIHSEISEAMEGDRKGLQDDHLPHRSMREVELADALIRIFDLAGAYNMDIGGALAEKLRYNQERADHKPEARASSGGKAY